MGAKPTIRDVAKSAGVSLTTVSYVLSGRHGGTTRISEATQERVQAAAKELGYVPNQAARGMRRGKTDLVAIAIGDLEWPWDRALASAAARILPEHGYQPVILLGEGWRRFMLSGGADGAIVGTLPPGTLLDLTVGELARRGVAQVVISDAMQPAGFDVLAPGANSEAAVAAPASEALEGAVNLLLDRLAGRTIGAGTTIAAPWQFRP
ncbi:MULTISPECIES: LacI family DNA-binding transcriptional regulator [Arthrobacter]|uniref:LacI family transcriptional regulator n=1 Tax=Arthrobacter terricola TaxID=2547396 RepID=A0A4V2ZTK1_9MICC|nr:MULTISPECIES: LacI family DNA-binding transcriptional regulator [Arthrobacter]MBT8160834.1 LacI family transcriptional regulator [Arthrobacter sp. GN70]TDF97404.1 LacI family transcriptional regulator [Arthrobacter terricola]